MRICKRERQVRKKRETRLRLIFVGWVERSDTQHIEAVSSVPSAIRRAKQVSRLPVAAALCRAP